MDQSVCSSNVWRADESSTNRSDLHKHNHFIFLSKIREKHQVYSHILKVDESPHFYSGTPLKYAHMIQSKLFFFFFKSNILAHRDYTFMCLIPDKVILTTCNFISIWQNLRKMRASQKAVRSARGRAAMAVWSLCETPELHGLNESSKFSLCAEILTQKALPHRL